ncbi:MAG: trehalose-phosphatase [Gammaproteobacteria bacterium]|nr:trehalose-phosphatase [Gammaproteobacteria bacterium]
MQLPPPLAGNSALFLDFDGTLVALAATPEAIVVPPTLVSLLDELRERVGGALAIVTGRPIESIDRFLDPLRLPVAGEHGVQRRDARGQMQERPAFDPAPIVGVAEALAREHPGLLVEPKHSGVSLHYRSAPELESVCRAVMESALTGRPQFELIHGKFVFEIKPASINKGSAIQSFMREAPFAGRVPVFAGDDTTDETGFAVVQPAGGGAIKVGAGPSLATHRLESSMAVLDWLRTTRDSLTQGSATS